jgi:hypothetical protein
LVNQALSGTRDRCPRTDLKTSIFQQNRPIRASESDQPKQNPDQDVADLTNPEPPAFNNFSNPHLHGDALTQIHDKQVQPL